MDRVDSRLHLGRGTPRRPRRYTGALVAGGMVVLMGSGGVAWARAQQPADHLLALGRPSPGGVALAPAAPRASGSPAGTAGPATGPSSVKKPRSKAKTTTTTAHPTTTQGPPAPHLISVSPRDGATNMLPRGQIVVKLSAPPRPGAAMPVLNPAVAGHWTVAGSALTFSPNSSFSPWAKETLRLPGSISAKTRLFHFQVDGVTVLRIQQLLAELRYLPFTFTTAPGQPRRDSEAYQPTLVPVAPRAGTFHWAYPNVPPSLSSLWSPGQYNVLTQGAIMHFESVEGLAPDGVPGPQVWSDLTKAAAHRKLDPAPYDYLVATETLPEQLVVWSQGKYIYQTPVNTGVPGATTQIGTFPVYLRYESTTMVGTDPDGTHYDVTGVPWVAYFNGGDAVHGYPRYSYGYPQSNGCVELPIANAQVVWGMDPIGTLVTVTGSPLPAGA